ncbi:thyroid adenoma-associated protein homolog [Brevipalpus obovatus]|uniref:thyroid adenoma-associated protein homolog n=1 Tax=Brevipalpus obovatus TaxID=246614 RepID=UPI003D9EE5CE
MSTRIQKRFEDILNDISSDDTRNMDELINHLKLLEADLSKSSPSKQVFESNILFEYFDVLRKIISHFSCLFSRSLSVQVSQKITSATQILFRIIYANFSKIGDNWKQLLFLSSFIETKLFNKVITLYDLIITSGILWTALQSKAMEKSCREIIENCRNFPACALTACMNGLLIEYPGSEPLNEIYGFDESFFLRVSSKDKLYEPDFAIVRSKYCFNLSRHLIANGGNMSSEVEQLLFDSLFTSVSERLESSIEAVRLCSFDTLKNLLSYNDRFGDGKLIENLLSDGKTCLDDYRGSLFRIICVAVQVIGPERALNYSPNLIQRTMCFIEDRNDIPSCIHEILSSLCCYDLRKFIREIGCSNPRSSYFVVDQVFPKLLKKETFLAKELASLGILSDSKFNLKFRLKLLHLLNTTLDSPPPQSEEILERGLFFIDVPVRMQAASIIIESKKSSSPLPDHHIDLVIEFIRENLNHQEPYNRQNFIALIGKLLTRIKCSAEASCRTGESRELIEKYITLLRKVCEICLNSLYIDSYFAQRYVASQVLLMTINCFKDSQIIKIGNVFGVTRLSRSIYSSLFLCILEDSLEDSKSLSIELLVELVYHRVIELSVEDITKVRQISFEMINSINPVNILSAVHLFKYLASLNALKDSKKMMEVCFDLLTTLANDAELSVESGNKSLLHGAAFNPIHSKLATIHGLLEYLDSQSLGGDVLAWQQLVHRLLNIVFSACECVKSIVCNDSPEGHLPMDLQSIDSELMSSILKRESLPASTSMEKRRNITSQMLLIFGWKTIKESSAIIALFCERFRHDTTNSAIMCCKDIETILNFFVWHLMNLKHRGAFEQAYNGFSVVIRELLKTDCQCMKVIDELLHDILQSLADENPDPNKVQKCITRRSAGLPFVIQAILGSNPAGIASHTFNSVITKLIINCKDNDAKEWQKIHSLNVLRALVKDYRLTNITGPFIENCLSVCIQSFTVSSYAVRNSSSLFFSSILTKIFGVNRGKDYHHKKNAMSAKHFFLLYPSMADLFSEIVQNHHDNRLMPVLLILLRLWPSAKEGDASLIPFVEPLLKICCSASHSKIRDLSGQILAQISGFDKVLNQSLIGSIREKLSNKPNSLNELDGLYTLIYHSVRISIEMGEEQSFFELIPIVNDQIIFLEGLVESEVSQDAPSSKHYNIFKPLISSLYLLLKSKFIIEEDQLVDRLHGLTLKILQLFAKYPRSIGISSSQNFVTELLSFSLHFSSKDYIWRILQFMLSNPDLADEMFHLKTICFHFLSKLFHTKTHSFPLIEDEILLDFELDYISDQQILKQHMDLASIPEILKLFQDSPEMQSLTSGKLSEPIRNIHQLLLVLFKISLEDPVSIFSLQRELLTTLFNSSIALTIDDETSALFLLFVSNSPALMEPNSELLHKYCDKVLYLCDIERSDLSRSIALNILENFLPPCIEHILISKTANISEVFFHSLAALWHALLKLLLDNEKIIRDNSLDLLVKLRKISSNSSDLYRGSFTSMALETFSEILLQHSRSDILVIQFFQLIYSQQSPSKFDDDCDERLFDKSKLNLFDDPVSLMKSLRDQLIRVVEKGGCDLLHDAFTRMFNRQVPFTLEELLNRVHEHLKVFKVYPDESLQKNSQALPLESLLEAQKYLFSTMVWTSCNVFCDSCLRTLKNSETKFIDSVLSELPLYVATEYDALIKNLKLKFCKNNQ